MKVLITFSILVLAKISFGQYQIYEQLLTPYLSDSIRSGYFYFNTPNNIQAGSLYQFYRTNAPDLNNNMILVEQHVDSLAGLLHYKYQQTFMNIPIEGAGCIEHYDLDGSLLFINAKIADSIKKEYTPRITAKASVEGLLADIKKDENILLAWEDGDWEQQIRTDNADSSATWYPTAELIWAIDTMKDMHLVIPGARYNLAYKISVTFVQPDYITYIYYVDANTGSILKIRSTRVDDGPADVYGYGSRIIDTQWKGGFTQKYILQTNDATRVIHTKKNPNGNTAWSFLDNTKDGDDNWGNSYLTETSTHFHVSTCWDYFRNVFGRTGQNNAGREIRVRTQYNSPNAFFEPNGGSSNNMTFGKSGGWDYGLEPSIVAHEFAHGVTHHTSNLEYSYESGALNESFSDIFGIVIQSMMLDSGTTDWILGNSIPNTPTRSMKNPNSLGSHYDASGNILLGQPDTYGGTYWYSGGNDNGGVHVNSGVQNKWFYILAWGENAYNDLSNYYDVSGIGMAKVARISYYALTSILMNSSQYSDSREATITAARILYGECSLEHQATIDAWYAVGIGTPHNCTLTVSLNEIKSEDVSIFPNPSKTNITFDLPAITLEPIRIFDITGNLVKEFENNNMFFQTDISDFANGVYLVNFNFNGNQIVKRIIVQK